MADNWINELYETLNASGEEEEKYINDTVFEQQNLDVGIKFIGGTVEINDNLAMRSKIAVQSRIESVKQDTEDRIERINKNWRLYYSNTGDGSSSKSLAKTFFPETFNSVEDWADDLYLIFEDLVDQLEMEDIGDNVEEYITKSLSLSAVDSNKQVGAIRSFLVNLIKKENINDKAVYSFQRKDAIKSMLKYAIEKSGYAKNVESYFLSGLISGMFLMKDSWGPQGKYQLVKSEDDPKEDKSPTNSYTYEMSQEDVYRFTPVDPRTLIYPKHGMPWAVEKVSTTFHDLLNLVLDDDGEPVKNPPYDIKRLKMLAKELKKLGASEIKEGEPNADEQERDDDSDTDINDLWDIDGDITVYEAHYIPMVLKEKDKNKVFKTLMTFVNLAKEEDGTNLFAIGIQKTPYVAGMPYSYTNFIKKDGDISGIGLPELVEPLQIMLNDFAGHSVDIMNLALWGIMFVDTDTLKDETKLKELVPRQIIKAKNMRGRSIDDIIKWMHPPLETVNQMESLFALFQNALRRTSRKGPSGEKITPNPSATEASNIIEELQKAVNKVGLRVNQEFVELLERIYIYNMLNRKENFKLRSQGMRTVEKENELGEETKSKFDIVDKIIELTPQELFVDGLNFKLKAMESFNKRAVERQQFMQAIQVLTNAGAITNPDGTPHIMIDETGSQQIISEYKIYSKLLKLNDVDDVFEKAPQQPAPQLAQEGQKPSGQVLGGQPPSITASPAPADIEQQGTTLSQGLNT